MTKTQQLAALISDIYNKHKADIDALPTRGVNGGTNAAYIDGWVNIGNGTITKAINKTGMPTLNYWSGSSPTPATAAPAFVMDDINNAYKSIFNN